MSNATQQPKERPIIFSAPMVRAILEGRKTQTRRIMKKQPLIDPQTGDWLYIGSDGNHEVHPIEKWIEIQKKLHCPYGRPGDRLYVRETWNQFGGEFFYKASSRDGMYPWRPSIHMPRAASRILLEITEIRVERVCDISEADAIAEGIECCDGWYRNYLPEGKAFPGVTSWVVKDGKRYFESPIDSFRSLWELINGPESWDNFVWVITSNRITP